MSIRKIISDTLTIKFDKAFGLDIGDRSVEIIELEKVFKFSVITYGRTELPAGIVENGHIINQNILAEKLKKLLKEAKPKKVSTNKVVVSLPESQVFVKCFIVESNLKGSALMKEIVNKATLVLPINIDKTYWEYVEKPMADKTKKLIIFTSVSKDIANSYVRFCNSIGLEVVSLCIESLSLARTMLRSSNKQSLIIDIGAGATNLCFFDSNDKVNMSVSIPVAGGQLTEAIKNSLKVELVEAEALKVKFGLKNEVGNKVLPIVLPIIEDLLNETRQAINYYEETFNQKLDDVYLIGGTALLPGINEVFKAGLKKDVLPAVAAYNTNSSVISGKDNSFPLIANVLGLGMLGASGEFRDINLIKKMPSSETNSINKLNLFNMGYLSKVNIVRTIMNNKFVLVVMLILIGVIFAVLFQQAKFYDASDVVITSNKSVITPKVKTLPLVVSTSTTNLATTTKVK